MPQLLTAVFLLLACIPAARPGVTTVSELSALEGRSIAAPCHYDPALAAHVKYWCWGIFKDTCTMVARTDTAPSDPRVSIVDDPAQQVFTVTMADLTEDQAGWYHCGAEEGGIWSKDPSAAVYLSVVHGMSVVNNRLDGEEGGSVAVDCLYSKRFRDIKKSWCRSGDPGSCQFTGAEGRFDSPSVTIADDRVGAFTVTLSKLRMADAGWYWCGVGTQKTAVQVLVTPRPSTTAVPVTSTPAVARSPEHISLESQLAHRHVLGAVVVFASFTLIVGMVLLARKIWQRHKWTQTCPSLLHVLLQQCSRRNADAGMFPVYSRERATTEAGRGAESKTHFVS
ncbi:polymeric immunoglobulin receptor isoform X2 [Gadus macrocephalus]|uniref:polymeric immunoglobulin receptor isoform X2 n=1 Tax=Gadus macrocephalus TaxID=80720 RepID=UPI0028CBAD30|nr:polymeric immunoglobulin receptor isoform X2 [Gadus macrocephalus]